MSLYLVLLIVLLLAAAGFFAGRARALGRAGGDRRALHSLPGYYGSRVMLWTAVPALLLLAGWAAVQPIYLDIHVSRSLDMPAGASAGQRSLVMADVRRVADGLDTAVAQGEMTAQQAQALDPGNVRSRLGSLGIALGSDVTAGELAAAQNWRALSAAGNAARAVAVLLLALVTGFWAWRGTDVALRARNSVEAAIRALLIGAALIAIATTLGIVLSLLFNTIHFFRIYPAGAFFFGTTWSPSFGGGSQLGILPLLWGTLYISLIALLVSVPIGLYAAIYLSEYASPPCPRHRQAAARGAGRHSDHRLRPVRAGHRGAAAAGYIRTRHGGLDARRNRGDDRRAGDGGDADPLRLVPVRRHHQRRAAVDA